MLAGVSAPVDIGDGIAHLGSDSTSYIEDQECGSSANDEGEGCLTKEDGDGT